MPSDTLSWQRRRRAPVPAPEAAPRPRRILFIEANTDGTVGGSHRAMFDLVTKLDRTRFEPVVLFYHDNVYVPRLRERKVEVHLFDAIYERERAAYREGGPVAKVRELVAAVSRRVRFLRREQIAMVHVNNSPRVGSDDWLPATRILRIPCIANVMGDARGESGRLRKVLFRSFDHYLPISIYIADAMEGHGIPRERMDLVYLGVDLEGFRARVQRPAEEVRAELGVGPGNSLAVMVGNVREWKGQHVVIEAVRRISPAARDRLHVAFAGAAAASDREYLAALQKSVEEAGLGSRITFLGGREDVPDLLNAADLALHASVRPEPFGLVVVEAMAMGKPIVAANTGGPGEVITADSGVTFDPREPGGLAQILELLVGDPDRRRILGAGALRRVEEFTADRYVAEVERVYHGLFRAHR